MRRLGLRLTAMAKTTSRWGLGNAINVRTRGGRGKFIESDNESCPYSFACQLDIFRFGFLLLLALAPLLLKLSEALSDLDTDRRDNLEFRLKRRETSSLIKRNDGVSII